MLEIKDIIQKTKQEKNYLLLIIKVSLYKVFLLVIKTNKN